MFLRVQQQAADPHPGQVSGSQVLVSGQKPLDQSHFALGNLIFFRRLANLPVKIDCLVQNPGIQLALLHIVLQERVHPLHRLIRRLVVLHRNQNVVLILIMEIPSAIQQIHHILQHVLQIVIRHLVVRQKPLRILVNRLHRHNLIQTVGTDFNAGIQIQGNITAGRQKIKSQRTERHRCRPRYLLNFTFTVQLLHHIHSSFQSVCCLFHLHNKPGMEFIAKKLNFFISFSKSHFLYTRYRLFKTGLKSTPSIHPHSPFPVLSILHNEIKIFIFIFTFLSIILLIH